MHIVNGDVNEFTLDRQVIGDLDENVKSARGAKVPHHRERAPFGNNDRIDASLVPSDVVVVGLDLPTIMPRTTAIARDVKFKHFSMLQPSLAGDVELIHGRSRLQFGSKDAEFDSRLL